MTLPRIEDISDRDLDTVWAKLYWANTIVQEAIKYTCAMYGIAPLPEYCLSWFQIGYTDSDETSIGAYDYDEALVRVSIRDLRKLFTEMSGSADLTEEHLIWYVTVHETIHHWQKLRGELPKESGLATRNDFKAHYSLWYEAEALRCTQEVFERRFGIVFTLSG